MLDKRNPLWMPTGSVRAVMALMFATVTCWMALIGQIGGSEFLAINGVIVAFYFGSKAVSK